MTTEKLYVECNNIRFLQLCAITGDLAFENRVKGLHEIETCTSLTVMGEEVCVRIKLITLHSKRVSLYFSGINILKLSCI